MKIDKIYISAFGKLEDYTINFNEGLNIIYGDNEDGKSTIMAFIKMMFYGSGRGSASISKNPRLKYYPWSNKKPAGRIYFEDKGINYCLEREFLKSDTTDKVTLTNTDTGVSQSVSSAVGSDFFGLTAQTFERTVFIGQIGKVQSDDGANDEINSKLSNIAFTGDEDTSFKTVFNRLCNAKLKLMSKSGKAGKYDKAKLELESLKQKIKESELKQERKNSINKRIEEIQKESSALIQQYKNTQKIIESENDIKNQKKLQEFLSLKKELDEINSKIRLKNGDLCDETFVKKVEFCLSKVQNAIFRIHERKVEIGKLKEHIKIAESKDSDEYSARKKEIENRILSSKDSLTRLQNNIIDLEKKLNETISNANTVRKKPFSPVLLIIGLISFTSSLIAFLAISNIIPIIGVIIGLAITILSFLLKPIDNYAKNKQTLELLALQSKISTLKTEESNINRAILLDTEKLNEIVSIENSDNATIEITKANLAEQNEKLIEDTNKYDLALDELNNVFSLYKESEDFEEIKTLLPELSQSAVLQKQIKLKLKYISDDLGGISYESAAEKLNNISDDTLLSDIDFEENRREAERLNEAISSLKSEYSALTTELRTAFKNHKNPIELSKKAEELQELLKEQEYFCETADIAAKALENSFIEIRRSYGSTLEKSSLEIFKKLTKGKYDAFNVSKSLDITVEESENFGTREIDYLSSGTADQAYLSLRLALSALMTEDNKLPVFLDDVFAQYDDGRAKIAIEFLRDYKENSQSILFTCHKSICDIATSLGITPKKLQEKS